MDIKDLEQIDSRTLHIKEGEPSAEVVLVDPTGGNDNMYFTFLLRYTKEESAKTSFSVIDPQHGEFCIEIGINSVTNPVNPIFVGYYNKDQKELYVDFVVEPPIASQDGRHSVSINFYTSKADGNN